MIMLELAAIPVIRKKMTHCESKRLYSKLPMLLL